MTTGLRETVLGVINRVERKLGLVASSAVTSTKKSRELLDMLNEVMDEISDAGDWQEYFRTTTVAAISSTASYEVAVSGLVKNVREIIYASAVSPLLWEDYQTVRQLNRTNNYGTPRQVCIEGVNASSGNPNFRVTPVPTDVSGKSFEVLYYQKPQNYTTSDGALVIPFPSNLVVQGLYAKALLNESGGAQTGEYQVAITEFIRMRREVANRFNADVGSDTYFRPRV
jgi:hypothetical protein